MIHMIRKSPCDQKIFFLICQQEILLRISGSKINVSPSWLQFSVSRRWFSWCCFIVYCCPHCFVWLWAGGYIWSLSWCALLCVVSCLSIVRWGRESWLLYFNAFLCHLTVSVLWLFLMVSWPWVGQQCVIVTFPRLTHLLFHVIFLNRN